MSLSAVLFRLYGRDFIYADLRDGECDTSTLGLKSQLDLVRPLRTRQHHALGLTRNGQPDGDADIFYRIVLSVVDQVQHVSSGLSC